MESQGSKSVQTKRKTILSGTQDFQRFSISYDVLMDVIISS